MPQKTQVIYSDCSVCGGTGKVRTSSQGTPVEIDCPQCGGSGKKKTGTIVEE